MFTQHPQDCDTSCFTGDSLAKGQLQRLPSACGGRRLNTVLPNAQMADALEFELPSDVEDDEEIDEDMAFTAEDKIRYAGMFGDEDGGGGEAGGGGGSDDADLLASDASEGGDFNADVSVSCLMCCSAVGREDQKCAFTVTLVAFKTI